MFSLSVAAGIDSCSEVVVKNVIKFLFFIVNKLQACTHTHTVQSEYSELNVIHMGEQRQFHFMGFSSLLYSSLRFSSHLS